MPTVNLPEDSVVLHANCHLVEELEEEEEDRQVECRRDGTANAAEPDQNNTELRYLRCGAGIAGLKRIVKLNVVEMGPQILLNLLKIIKKYLRNGAGIAG
jgi:hypothetical protein